MFWDSTLVIVVCLGGISAQAFSIGDLENSLVTITTLAVSWSHAANGDESENNSVSNESQENVQSSSTGAPVGGESGEVPLTEKTTTAESTGVSEAASGNDPTSTSKPAEDATARFGAEKREAIAERKCGEEEKNHVFLSDNQCGVFNICELENGIMTMYQYVCPNGALFDHTRMRCHPKLTCEGYVKARLVPIYGQRLQRTCPKQDSSKEYQLIFSKSPITSCGEYRKCVGPKTDSVSKCDDGAIFNETLSQCDPRTKCTDVQVPINCLLTDYDKTWLRDPQHCNRAWRCVQDAQDGSMVPFYQLCPPGQMIEQNKSELFRCVTGSKCPDPKVVNEKTAGEKEPLHKRKHRKKKGINKAVKLGNTKKLVTAPESVANGTSPLERKIQTLANELKKKELDSNPDREMVGVYLNITIVHDGGQNKTEKNISKKNTSKKNKSEKNTSKKNHNGGKHHGGKRQKDPTNKEQTAAEMIEVFCSEDDGNNGMNVQYVSIEQYSPEESDTDDLEDDDETLEEKLIRAMSADGNSLHNFLKDFKEKRARRRLRGGTGSN